MREKVGGLKILDHNINILQNNISFWLKEGYNSLKLVLIPKNPFVLCKFFKPLKIYFKALR